MAPWSISSEAYLKGYYVFTLIFLLSVLCRVLSQCFYLEATAVVAAAITIDDTVARAFAAHSFFTALYYICSLLNCARKRLTNASLATETEQTLLNTPGAVRTTMWCLLCHTYVFAHQWMTADIVSLKHPLLQNFKVALMYTLRGLDVLFVAFLIFVFVRWLKQGSPDVAAQAPPPPVQVLDDGAATKEKEYVERLATHNGTVAHLHHGLFQTYCVFTLILILSSLCRTLIQRFCPEAAAAAAAGRYFFGICSLPPTLYRDSLPTMAQWPISTTAYFKTYCVFTLILILSSLCRTLIQRFCPEAAAATAAGRYFFGICSLPPTLYRDSLPTMAQWPISTTAYFKTYCVFTLILILSSLCRTLIQRFCPEPATAAAITVDNTDAYLWLTGASPAARPIALEEEPLIPHTDTDAERIVLNARGAWIRADIVSLEHPLLRNVTSVLMYTLRGLDIPFVAFLIFVFVRWLKQRQVDAAAQAPAPLVQVLDDAVATKEEKEYVEAKA
ncbi:hypothetical protein B0H13DRAFT_2307034 [Mycena leptocephala]|nr:hypothetical protein B0H13DRAFT_2307034 [Mycena leptocephala]